jgi:hypothetical protein
MNGVPGVPGRNGPRNPVYRRVITMRELRVTRQVCPPRQTVRRAVNSGPPPGPVGGVASTAQGHSYGIFKRAVQRRHVLAAVAAAKELRQLSLSDALDLTMLVARKDPKRHDRMAARWLLRLLEEDPDVTIQEAALAGSSLAALPGAGYLEAVQVLKAMSERATSRRRSRGVA